MKSLSGNLDARRALLLVLTASAEPVDKIPEAVARRHPSKTLLPSQLTGAGGRTVSVLMTFSQPGEGNEHRYGLDCLFLEGKGMEEDKE